MKWKCYEYGNPGSAEEYGDVSPEEAAEMFAGDGDLDGDDSADVVVEPADEEARQAARFRSGRLRFRVDPEVKWVASEVDFEERDREAAAVARQVVRR